MKILLTILLTTLLTSCIEPLPPCEGTEEQIYRCESLRIQRKQLKVNRYRAIQESNNLYTPSSYKTYRY